MPGLVPAAHGPDFVVSGRADWPGWCQPAPFFQFQFHSSSQFRELHYLVMKGTNATDRPLTVHLLASRLPHPRQVTTLIHSPPQLQ